MQYVHVHVRTPAPRLTVLSLSGAVVSGMFDGIGRSIDDSFYRRPAWKKCRAAYIAHRQSIDGGLCQKCGQRPGKIVHHLTHLTPVTAEDPDVAYGFDNLELLCLDCHNVEHGFKAEETTRMVKYFFDRNGNPVPR